MYLNLFQANLLKKKLMKILMMKIQQNDPFLKIKITALNNKRKEGLEAIEAFKQKQKILKCERAIKEFMTRQDEVQQNNKIKSMTDFDENHTNSIKSTAIKTFSTVKLTTCFVKGNMLMFSKTSLISLVYDIIDIICFLDENVKKIYEKCNIQKCFLFL